MPFDTIIGHSIPIRILRSMLESEQLPHAFLFSGIDGIGKRLVAACFVKAVNCPESRADFCDRCSSCSKIDRMVHPDVLLVEPEKNLIKIDQIRAIQDEVVFKPVAGRKKAVIIDQAEKLHPSAANCLLKTLEEPPDDTILILVACSTAAMLPTVISRCQRVSFLPLSPGDIRTVLCRRGADDLRAGTAAQLARGSISRALVLLEDSFPELRHEIAEKLCCGVPGNGDVLLGLSERLKESGDSLPLVLEFLETWYRDILLLKEGLPPAALYNSDIVGLLRDAERHESRDGIISKLKKVHWIQNNAILNMDMQLVFETMFMQVI